EPSTTRPFLISKSYAIGFLLALGSAAARPDRQNLTTQSLRQSRAFPTWIGPEPCGNSPSPGPRERVADAERWPGEGRRALETACSPLSPTLPYAALSARPCSACGPVRIALRGLGPESGHGVVERDGHRAGRQRHANGVRSQYAAARLRAGVSRRVGRAIEPRRLAGSAERRRLHRTGGARLGGGGARLLPGASRRYRVHGRRSRDTGSQRRDRRLSRSRRDARRQARID